jgi:hypothetical protein
MIQAPNGFNEIVLSQKLNDFPSYVYFVRDSPDFD